MSLWRHFIGRNEPDTATPRSNPAPADPSTPASAQSLSPVSRPAAAADPGAKAAAAKDRVVRVFVSSTFKDMVEDRNELMARVWPALRRICRGRAVEFVEVDLRWGVTEEQSQRNETLRHCLAEIKRCRPFFIGLLGERYGWTPGPEAFPPALLDEEDWLKNEVAKHSVTELEILHGVHNAPEMAGRAFFYFRDPQHAASKGGDYLSEDTTRPTRQDALKQKVKAVCAAKQIPLRENYADPRALADLVLTDLTAAINAAFPADQVPDVWSREDRDHEAYAKSRRTDFYVGRDAYFDRLDAYARDGARGCALTVLGASGGGKSALLANWVARWRQARPGDFVFQHYIGSSAMSAAHLALMRRLMVAIIRWCGADDPSGARVLEEEERKIPAHADEIIKVFPDYLGRLAVTAKQKGVGAVLVLDALNQLEDRDRGRLLAWLPHRLPGELRLIVSTLPGDTFDALHPRGWPAFTVEPLTPDERVELIARYLKHFAQGLSNDRARRIAGVAAASNPLYIKTLLDDLRVTGDYQKLDQQIDYYLKAADIPALLGKILTRFEHDYERDRPGLVREALSLLWAARRGLTEPELLEALKPAGQMQLPAALWSPLRCALEDGLVDRDGVLAFAHEHLRTAVQHRYLSKPKTVCALRLRLADLFEARPVDIRQADELPWLLSKLEARDRLRTCLLDVGRFVLLFDLNEDELRRYWTVTLHDDNTLAQSYVHAFNVWLKAPKPTVTRAAYVANQLSLFLSSLAFHGEAELLMRTSLEEYRQEFSPTHPNVSLRLNNLAIILQDAGRLAESETLIRQALAIDEVNYGPAHPAVARCVSNLAMLLLEMDRALDAEPLMRRALEIETAYYGLSHPNVAIRLDNLAGVLAALNRSADAEDLSRRALAINEVCCGPDHPSVATVLGTLAQLAQDNFRLTEAEAMMGRSLRITERNFGTEHPRTAEDLLRLATILQDMNRGRDVEPLVQRALAINERFYGSDSPKLAVALLRMADLLLEVDRVQEAERFAQSALAAFKKTYGDVHPHVSRALNTMAQLHQRAGHFHDAETLLRRALMIDAESDRINRTVTIGALCNLGVLLKLAGRLEEAEPMQRKCLAVLQTRFGPMHPKVSIMLTNLAQLLQATKRIPEAEKLMRQALSIDRQRLNPNHPQTAVSLNNLGQLLRMTDRVVEAEPLLRQSAEVLESCYGAVHPKVAIALNNLGAVLISLNRMPEAEALIRRALKMDESQSPPNLMNMPYKLLPLSFLLHKSGHTHESELYAERALCTSLEFSRQARCSHPCTRSAADNLAGILHANGVSRVDIIERLRTTYERFGLNFDA
ncbi:tetratricopeptide repeat protein [Oligosphaera ethanolica]|uniref:Tetratricopeptide (TPR) repeat protein n=1 Tax=Oligosphaera ethanolica TaxID=760260 RepID=A0AAE3VJF3_9BACT|nr:tetratricopeptide repeat protein [Oligosphaera ethanolica]MDQ0291573.1 tetratricopeptide (TPR) repeat protein [Oligosphaera ethanolica]MDQ0291908.1 tetratricopeptide (TPR) repeat protein [Oligosphaera ethanolica]